MKKYLILLAVCFIVAGLMAVAPAPKRNVDNPGPANHYRTVFYAEDFESGATGWTHYDGAVTPNNWHIYNNGDAQGNVWWMGDPALASGTGIGGYHSHQYLVLDTPQSTIAAGNTNLTFKMRMNMEEPGASGEFNGWDSFNIRVSTNAGISYSVIPTTLITPGYDFTSSYAFGSEHGETPPVPAWGGVHEPWVTVTVDLSSYVGSSVKIRFAFASDPAYDTIDDPAMYGVMVDDIAFGTYSNNGVDDTQMTFASLVPTAGDFWHVATDASAPSPTHIMSSMNSAGTYAPNMLNYLESPEITLPGDATQIVADFQMKGTYSDTGTFPDVDYFGWEIFYGGTWHYMSNPYDDPEGSNYVYSGAPDTWASMVLSYTLDGDITLLAGQTVKFAWYFQSNETVNGTPLQIDDFQIFSVSAAPAPPNLVYPINGQTGLPYSGFDLDWTANSQGALPEYYTVYLDQDSANLELDTFNPAYTSADLTISLYNPVDAGLVTFASSQRWYWRVGATIVGQDEALSDIFRFDIVNSANVITTFPWTEGFEATFPPTNWTRGNVDGDATQWAQNATSPYYHSGTKSAYHIYSTATAEPGQNGWLITPPIEIPTTGTAIMTFWNYNRYGGEVYNGVLINSNNDPTSPFWTELWTQDETAGHWAQEGINLATYAGQVVHFAFKYTGYDANSWYVDDVAINVYTSDVLPPSIVHLPNLNTPREDLPIGVYASIQDDPGFNNPIGGATVTYSIDGGTNWFAPINMTAGTTPAYSAEIPAQALGTTVTYKISAWDNLNNTTTTANYSFLVNDPVWLKYDKGGTGYTGYPTYVWGPLTYYENPFYGSGNAMRLLAVDGAVHNNNTGNPPTAANLRIYTDDGVDMINVFTGAISLPHRTRTTFDISASNIQIDTPWFWIGIEDMPTGCYYLVDANYNYYDPTYIIMGGSIYTTSIVGEWAIGAYIQTGDATGLAAPVITIANVAGSPVVSWDAVAGAHHYDVYGAIDPYAPDPWNLLDSPTATTYTYSGPADKQFFKVVADSVPHARGIGSINKANASSFWANPNILR
jgi:hypothetical protein